MLAQDDTKVSHRCRKVPGLGERFPYLRAGLWDKDHNWLREDGASLVCTTAALMGWVARSLARYSTAVHHKYYFSTGGHIWGDTFIATPLSQQARSRGPVTPSTPLAEHGIFCSQVALRRSPPHHNDRRRMAIARHCDSGDIDMSDTPGLDEGPAAIIAYFPFPGVASSE